MSQDINTEIAALDYNPAEILSIQGDDTTSYIPNRGIHDKQKYIVIHKEPVTLKSETVNLSALENIESTIYPANCGKISLYTCVMVISFVYYITNTLLCHSLQ